MDNNNNNIGIGNVSVQDAIQLYKMGIISSGQCSDYISAQMFLMEKTVDYCENIGMKTYSHRYDIEKAIEEEKRKYEKNEITNEEEPTEVKVEYAYNDKKNNDSFDDYEIISGGKGETDWGPSFGDMRR